MGQTPTRTVAVVGLDGVGKSLLVETWAQRTEVCAVVWCVWGCVSAATVGSAVQRTWSVNDVCVHVCRHV
jgi:GTPase SAR1 family protein